MQGHVDLFVCSFSPDGTYLVAGANDCTCYVWAWEQFGASKTSNLLYGSREPERSLEEEHKWLKAPRPTELCRLPGHKNDVLLLQFSHDGNTFATGSRDGAVRVSSQFPRTNKC